ncbi:hypothetical protein OAF98_03195 [Planctomicrobium sp.]|nr:hypothetical protein [Planctomicrobium sp.]MDA7527795.1 hypothetical protein [bacterium]MDB4743468.1 hypothetical protein [Planctomicrobium sp.]
MMRTIIFMLSTAIFLYVSGSTRAIAQDADKQTETAAVTQRLQPKIQLIQKELPGWLEKTGNQYAVTLMQKLAQQVEAKEFAEAEKTADSLLKILGMKESAAGANPAKPSPSSPEETRRRLTEKVERVQAAAQKWAASGRDPSGVLKIMQQKFQPLMKAGKAVEAEAVVDDVLKQLGANTEAPTPSPVKGPASQEEVLKRIHLIQKHLPNWDKKTGTQVKYEELRETMKKQLAEKDFAAAEKTADEVLKLIGFQGEQVSKSRRPMPNHAQAQNARAHAAKQANNPFAGFIPPQLIFLASEQISLTPEQRKTLIAHVNKTQPQLKEFATALERESAALSTLILQQQLDEEAIIAQLNKFMDIEREAKRLQARQGIVINNMLTVRQRDKLLGLSMNPDVIAKLEHNLSQRISAKAERVQAVAVKWGQSGRDPSPIAQMMAERVQPLMESERVFEAEAELDLILVELEEDGE